MIVYDSVANAFQHLDTATGIWVTFSCTGVTNGGNCTVGTPTTVGALANITTSGTGGTSCPFMLHDSSMNKSNGMSGSAPPFLVVTEGGGYLCSGGPAFPYQVWNPKVSAFNASNSLETTNNGLNHSTGDMTELVAFSGTACGSADAGCFNTIYNYAAGVANLSSMSTSIFLKPSASPSGYPPQCNSTVATLPSWNNPTCNLGAALDSHLSCVAGCDHGSYNACGTTYNYATLGPAFNAWQNMETCWPTFTQVPVASLPGATMPTAGMSQFTHTFATGAITNFNSQFQISELSQDGNWLFWSSDWGGCLGSTTGSAPTVWASGTYYQKLIYAQTNSPCSPITSLSGYPWIPANSYVQGDLTSPIEGTNGQAGVDDVFQAIWVDSGGKSGNRSTLASGQPKCGTTSCFANSTPPNNVVTYVAGQTICDAPPTTASFNPSLPYATSCAGGVVWQDLGPATQRGDVFAVRLFGATKPPPAPSAVMFLN